MSDQTNHLVIQIDTALDAKALKQAVDALKSVQNNVKDTKSGLSGTTQSAAQLAAKLGDVAKVASVAGAALSGGLVLAAQQYITNAQTSTTVSRQWLAATWEIGDAYNRVGKVVAGELIPYLNAAAGIAGKLAGFAEQNPKLVGGAVELGKTMLVGGGLTALLTKLGGPIGTALGTGATMWSTIGQGASLVGANIFEKITGKKAPSLGEIVMGALGIDTKAAAKADTFFTEQQLEIYKSYHRQEILADRQHQIQLYKVNRDFDLQQTYAQQDYNKSVFRANRDHERQELFSQKMFHRQQALAQRDYNIQLARNDYDFQKSRNRANQDHQFELYQIALSGDAMQYWLSERQYKIDQERQKEDYELQRSRGWEDFQRQQGDAAAQFEIEREQRQLEFDVRMSDMQIDFEIQRTRAKKQHDIQLDDQKKMWDEEATQRRQALFDSLDSLYNGPDGYRVKMQQFNQAMLDDLGLAINAALKMVIPLTQTTPLPYEGPKAIGGYTNDAYYQMHRDEFVLTAATTHAAEQAAQGAHLNQDIIMGLLSGGRSVSYADHRQFNTAVSASDRAMIQNDTRSLLLDLLG